MGQDIFFFQNWKKVETEKFVFYDPQHLSFVKDIYVVSKKITKNGQKMAIYES